MRTYFRAIAVFVAALLLFGCPSLWKAADQEKPLGPDELFKDAEGRFAKKDYDAAIEKYERLKSAHPEFKKIADVYLKIADGFYQKGDYDKAIARYQQFIELNPGNPEIPHARYNIAMCYFKQIKRLDLDSRVVQAAADKFKEIMDDPNAGDWGKKAKEKFEECMKKRAEKEMYKARTYVNMGKYSSARLAAKRVLEEYGKLGFDKEAEDLIKSVKGK